jgi:hypothetical protein
MTAERDNVGEPVSHLSGPGKSDKLRMTSVANQAARTDGARRRSFMLTREKDKEYEANSMRASS